MTEGFDSSIGLKSVELGQDGVTLPPEDIAWADSCLSKDPDISDSGWNSLKEALLETLDSQLHISANQRDNSPEVANTEIFSSGKAVVSIAASSEGGDCGRNSPKYQSSPYDGHDSPLVLQPPLREIPSDEDVDDILDLHETPVSLAATSEVAEPSGGDRLNQENTDDFWSKHKVEDVFLPTYNENLRDLGVFDPEMDFVFQEFESEQSTEDIFRIWEFDIPPEENDLMKQLNKALSENSLEPTPPVSDDSEAWKALQDESLEDLVSGIADLALTRNSG